MGSGPGLPLPPQQQPPNVDGMISDLFGLQPGDQQDPALTSAAMQAKAFSDALAYIERHQLPISKAQAAGLTLLRMLDDGTGRYASIVEDAERHRLSGGPARDFVQALQSIAMIVRPKLFQVGGRRR